MPRSLNEIRPNASAFAASPRSSWMTPGGSNVPNSGPNHASLDVTRHCVLRAERRGMASDASFDVVSDFDQQELVNALDQARREILTRYDFKGSKAEIELGKDEIVFRADNESRARAMRDLLESKAIRRGLSLKIFDWAEIEEAGGNTVRQTIGLRRGLPEDLA